MEFYSAPHTGFHLENCRRGGKYRILDAGGVHHCQRCMTTQCAFRGGPGTCPLEKFWLSEVATGTI